MDLQKEHNDSLRGTVASADIKSAAANAGFSLCGIAPYRTMPEHIARLGKWLGEARHGNLGYMERNVEKRGDPRELFPGTRAVVVCAVNYRNSAWDVPAEDGPKIASYAFSRDYHRSIKSMLGQMLSGLQNIYPALKGRTLTDTAPIFEKAWAVESGLGWIGKNSLLVTPQYGSSVLIGELLIDHMPDKFDAPYSKGGCGKCGRCIDACPNGAISAHRTIDTTRCISRLTVEPDPPAADINFDNWVFGCDACQQCCPHNTGKPLFDNPLFAPVVDPAAIDTDYWRNLSLEKFIRTFTGTPMERSWLEKVFEKIKGIIPIGE